PAPIKSFVNGRAWPAVDDLPRQPLFVVCRGVEDGGVPRVHDEIDDARGLVDVEDLLPCLAAVDSLEDAALGILREEMADRSDVDGVRVRRIDRDAGDVV